MLAWLRSQPVARTLPALIVMTAIAVGSAIALIAHSSAQKSMREAAAARLEGLKEGRRIAVLQFVSQLEAEVSIAAQRASIRAGLLSLRNEFAALDPERRSQILERYTSNNPFPKGFRAALEAADDQSLYSILHRELHRVVQPWAAQWEFHDVLLVDSSGNVVYSMAKEDDFGTNFINGEFAITNASLAFRQVAANVPAGRTYFTDFENYEPSGSPAAFLGTRVTSDTGDPLGVLMVQFGPAYFNKIMDNRVGLGDTGETYLVGRDLFLRTSTRHLPVESVLKVKIDTENARRAVSGFDGIIEATDYRGQRTLTAYGPIDTRHVRWGLVAKLDLEEVDLPIRQLQQLIFLTSFVLIVLFAGIGALYSRRITRPLAAVQAVMDALAAGKRHVMIPYLDRTDEFGRMTNAVQVFQQALVKNDQLNESVRGAEARLLTMLDRSPICVMVQNRAGVVRFVNEPGAALLGSTPKKMIGAPATEFARAARDEDWKRFTELFRRQGSVHEMELDFLVGPSGRRLATSFTVERMTFADEACMLMWVTDITERKQAAERLRVANFLSDQALDLAKAGYWHVPLNADDGYYNSSERAATIFGDLPRKDWRYHVMNEWFANVEAGDKAASELTLKNFTDAVAGTVPRYDSVYAYKRPVDGRIVWIHAMGHVVRDAGGKPTDMYGVTMDITEAISSAREVDRQRATMAALINSVPDLIFYKAPEGIYLGCNEAFAALIGKPVHEVAGKTDYDLFPREVADFFRSKDAAMLASLESTANEEWVDYPDGRRVLLDTLKCPFWDSQGKLLGILGISRDITARKKSEAEIDRQRQVLKAVFAHISQGLSVINADLVLVEANPRFGEVLQLPDEIAKPGNPAAVMLRYVAERGDYGPGDPDQQVEARLALMRNPKPHRFERRTSDGRTIEVEGNPMPDGGIVTTYSDITERKRAEEELQKAKDAAEEATRAKSSFLAMMSHEIRTPMNGVMSMAEVLDQTELSEDQRSMTRVILQSADALRTIINDILDFSKIEVGKLDIESVDLDLVDLVESVGDLLAPRAEEKWLGFYIDVDPTMPRKVRGDPSRLRQILLNLCGNALKFTEEGSVQILVTGRRDGDRWIGRFEIVDTGIGLTEAQRTRLFQPFTQADASTSRRFGGTGLGLTISRRLCELMGGEIGVVSEIGKGSTFWFELAMPVVDVRPYASEVDLAAARVLLVRYDRNEARILQHYLKHVGVTEIYFAPPPGEEIPLARALARIDKPMDLVVVNAREGAGQTRKILDELKNHSASKDARDVVTAPHLAASILRADAKSLADVQWLATLTTPIHMRRFWQVVGIAIGKIDPTKAGEERQERQTEYVAPEIGEAAAARAVILVAEDNATNRVVIKRVLGRLGYAHELAVNGSEALRMWEADRARYGLLLSDFHMPEMDGFELTRAIRDRESATGASRLPIVALTADVLPQTRKECLDAGMDGYLRKPIELPALHEALEQWIPQALPLRRTLKPAPKAAAPTPPAPAAAPPAPAAASPSPPPVPSVPIDHTVIAQQIGTDDMGEHAACLESFWESCGQGPEELQTALAARDAKAVREAAHGLKGAAAMIGAKKLAETLKVMEYAGRDGDLKTVEGRMGTLQVEFQEVRAYLDTLAGHQTAPAK